MISLYYLRDPRTLEVRYVGYSAWPHGRFKKHLRDAGTCYKARWIQSLSRQNLRPVLSICCVVENYDEAKRIEIALIARYKDTLTNRTKGGDGTHGLFLSEESREKISKTLRGRPIAPEVRAARFGKKRVFTEAHRAALSVSKIGKKVPKLSEARRQYWVRKKELERTNDNNLRRT